MSDLRMVRNRMGKKCKNKAGEYMLLFSYTKDRRMFLLNKKISTKITPSKVLSIAPSGAFRLYCCEYLYLPSFNTRINLHHLRSYEKMHAMMSDS